MQLFKEEQKFTQWWLWFIMFGLLGYFLIKGYKQIIMGLPQGNNPIPDVGLIITIIILIGAIVFLRFIKLTTEIDYDEIRIRHFPLIKKTVQWTNIKSANVINYGCVGGWGIRLFTKYGTVYNIRGNMGLAIEMKNGKRFLIGTQEEIQLEEVIRKIKKRYTQDSLD